MPPLTSGRPWERLRPDEATPVSATKGINESIWLRDSSSGMATAHFKYPSSAPNTSPYSLGIERVAYSLATDLNLPVAETYLESFDGHTGVLTIRVPGDPWEARKTEIREAKPTFLDRERWPLYVGFDLLLANPDRHTRNVCVEWDPPGAAEIDGEVCTTWLIDYGLGGLWPGAKFGAATLADVDPDADYTPEFLDYAKKQLLAAFRNTLPPPGDADRAKVVEDLRRIEEDRIREAVREVPSAYMTSTEATLTIELLSRRLGRIDTLLDTVFPF
jgi:hypothetical protein